MNEIIDIEYSEFFSVGDKVNLNNKFGLVVETYKINQNNFVSGGNLIICWDSPVDYDIQIIESIIEPLLIKIHPSYKFYYIDDNGNPL